MASLAAGLTATRRLAARGAGFEAWLERERHQLPLWLPVAFGLGIAAYFVLPWAGQRAAVAVAMAAVVVLGAAAGGRTARVLVWGGVLVVLGLGVAQWRTADVAAAVLRDRYQGDVAGVVAAVEIRSGRGQVRLVVVPDDPGLPRRVRIGFRSGLPAGVVPGARISVRAALSPPAGPSYPGGYDFARRAWFAGLGATGYPLGALTVTQAAPPPTGLAARFADLRTRLTARLQAAVPGPAGGIAAAFVTGDQGGIPEDVAAAWRSAGLAHILSISGLHIAIVVGGTMWLTRAVLALSPWLALRWPVKTIAAATAAVAGIFYTLLAGGEVPTVRACIATVVVLLGIVVGREALSLRLVAAGAFLILAVRPEALLGPSFQLSFAAVTGLVALYQSRAGRWLGATGEGSWVARLGRRFLALVCTGLVAEAMLSATALFHFNQAGTYGVVANLIAIPWTSFVVMPLLLVALLLDVVGLGGPAYWLLGEALGLLIALAAEVAGWPGAVARLGLMPASAYALLVGGGLWLCLWRGHARWLGVAPIVLGAGVALAARPPDLLVSADGRHVALLIGEDIVARPRLALLRDRTGDYLREMWGGATAATADAAIADLPGADCGIDACVARIGPRGSRLDGSAAGPGWRLLATLSKDTIAWPRFAPACAAADIVISDRRLPLWCEPRWLKLDRGSLERSGAVAIWLEAHRVETVAATVGDHPWLPQPQVWRPGPRRTVPDQA